MSLFVALAYKEYAGFLQPWQSIDCSVTPSQKSGQFENRLLHDFLKQSFPAKMILYV